MFKKFRIVTSLSLLLLLCSITTSGFGQTGNQYRGPIIDMHLHAYTNEDFFGPAPNPVTGEMSTDNATEHRRQTVEILKNNNIVLSMVDGESPVALDPWEQILGDGVIRGLRFENPEEDLDLNLFTEWVEEGKIELLGEVGMHNAGYSPDDSILDPYLKISEEFDIPVGIHTGGTRPGIHLINPDFRLRYTDPFLVEDILVTYPNLRIYLMHSGSHFYERTAMLMVQYPNLYSDIAILNWFSNAEVFLVPFLQLAKEYNVLDRVMFGTDQMIWSENIEIAIEKVQSLDFLTLEEKAGIFYMNAARFLNLSQETIAEHHDQM